MAPLAALLSLALSIVFFTVGVQGVTFSSSISHVAEELRVPQAFCRRISVLAIVGAVALLVGLTAKSSTVAGLINVVGALALAVLGVVAVVVQRRGVATWRAIAPVISAVFLCALEVVARFLA